MSNLTYTEEIDSRNVLNIVSNAVREVVIKTYQEHPEYQDMDEGELERATNPSYNASLIRDSFWCEYKKAQDSGRKMMMSHVYSGVFTKDAFYKFLADPKQVAWMMCPPTDEFLQMRVDNYKRRQEFSRISRMPLFDDKGNLKHKDFQAAVTVYKLYADRIHGAVIQRIEKKTQHLSANDIGGDPDELRKELEALRDTQAEAIDISKKENK